MKLDIPEPNETIAVARFRQYLRIETVQPNPDYQSAKTFLELYAAELNFPVKHLETVPGKWVTVMTCEGTDPNKKSILLNSHIDVVPVYPDYWKYPPFSAHKEENGDIYARGSQDMKLVGIQYVEALREMLATGWKPERTFQIIWVPDEEIGGADGMKIMLEKYRPWFDALNVGFELDEGLANPDDEYRCFYGERSPWWVVATAKGQPGHGSQFIKNTAAEQMANFVAKVMKFRVEQESMLEDPENKECTALGDVTTVNWTMCQGGVQPNVVPAEMECTFDFRITPKQNMDDFGKMLNEWADQSGPTLELAFTNKNTFQGCTSLEDPHWLSIKSSLEELGLKYRLEIFPAATDARFLRETGIPSIGFSPMIGEDVLLHDHNEKLNEKTFLDGVQIYKTILKNICTV